MNANASVKTSCDACKAALGKSYPNKKGSISVNLKDGVGSDGYDDYKCYDFCGESCLRDFLNARAKKAKSEAVASINKIDIKSNLLEIDATQSEAYKKFKQTKETAEKAEKDKETKAPKQ